MNRTALSMFAAATLPMGASAQLEIRHNSHVGVRYAAPLVVLIEDSIEGASDYEPFSLSHFVSYDDPILDFDPIASSSFSVDSVEFVSLFAPNSPFGYYDITISGELSRRGPEDGSGIEHFLRAQSQLTVDFGGTGFAVVTQYSITCSYESDSTQFEWATLPLVSVQSVLSDDLVEVLHTLEADGATGSDTFSGGFVQGGPLRIEVVSDPLKILVQHLGATTVSFEGTIRVLTNVAPEPCLADTNNDGEVTAADFSAWIAAFNASAPECDQNGDGACTAADFSAWISNFNAGCD